MLSFKKLSYFSCLLRLFILMLTTSQFSHAEVAVSHETKSEQADQAVVITLKDGQQLTGNMSCKEDQCTLSSGSEMTLKFKRSSVQSIEYVGEQEKDKRTKAIKGDQPEPNRTRYLYSPSAFSLKSGEAYLSQKQLFFTSVAYGVTDQLTLLAGAIIPAWALGLEGFNMILGGKYAFELSDHFRLAVGSEAFIFPELKGGLVQTFIGLTYGTQTDHLTLNVGKPFLVTTDEEFRDSQDNGLIMFSLSGNTRLTELIRLVSENWLIVTDASSEYLHFNSLAARFQGAKMAADLGFIFFGVDGTVFPLPLPWLDFTYNF